MAPTFDSFTPSKTHPLKLPIPRSVKAAATLRPIPMPSHPTLPAPRKDRADAKLGRAVTNGLKGLMASCMLFVARPLASSDDEGDGLGGGNS